MRRREASALAAALPNGSAQMSPIAVVWATPTSARTPAGHCPKCGAHIGRAIRAHAKNCDGKQDPT